MISKRENRLCTIYDLEDYASLRTGNTFMGTLNVFQSIGFLNNINK